MNIEPSHSLMTIAETSAFKRTGRTDEVERLCAAISQRWPDAIRAFEYGRSAEGRAMLALLATRTGALTAEEIKRRGIPLLMLQAGIHPGESDGKDAGFMAVRELLEGTVAPTALEHIAILFVPAFNVDGHERFGRWNRPNQIGPEEMGWRATAQNLNLNRDYTKADAPEMRAMLCLIDEWDPLVCADLHVTDGADFQPDISVQVEPVHAGDPELFASGTELRDALIEHLKQQGSMPLPFYPDLVETDDPASGFHLTVYSPRFSSGYFPCRNRFAVLVETHSWKSYATRVRVTFNTIIGMTELVAKHGRRWLKHTAQADARAQQLAGTQVALDFAANWREPTGRSDSTRKDGEQNVTMIDFPGYAYTREPSAISGELVTRYDPSRPQVWRVPFRKNTAPSLLVRAPKYGYLITAAHAEDIGDRLALHGIEFHPLERALTECVATVFRASRVEFAAKPFEGRMRAGLHGDWREERCDAPAGSLIVPIAQPLARLIMALLEPQAPDSFAAWGFFNSWFEQKEYLEPYVTEIIASELLKQDGSLRSEFERLLRSDPAFAADPQARREFFLHLHASWDRRYNLYPVYRLEHAP